MLELHNHLVISLPKLGSFSAHNCTKCLTQVPCSPICIGNVRESLAQKVFNREKLIGAFVYGRRNMTKAGFHMFKQSSRDKLQQRKQERGWTEQEALTAIPTVFLVVKDLHLLFISATECLRNHLDCIDCGQWTMQKVTGAWLLHDFRSWITT